MNANSESQQTGADEPEPAERDEDVPEVDSSGSDADDAPIALAEYTRAQYFGEFDWFGSTDSRNWWGRFLVLAAAVALFIPFLGSFGLWDPWETHYGEVARQILERNDWISTWWGSHWKDASGSSQGHYFFSKPALLMWLMAMGMRVFGFSEWGLRLGVALISIVGVTVVYSVGASIFKRRTGYLMAGVLGTSPFWFFLSRQAQTDMPFVGLMTAGLGFFMMAMFGADRDKSADLFSYLLTGIWFGIVAIPQVSLVLVGLSRWRGHETNGFMTAFTDPLWQGVAFGGTILIVGAVLLVIELWRHQSQPGQIDDRNPVFAWAAVGTTWGPLLCLLVPIMVASQHPIVDLQGWFVWGPTQAAIYATCIGVVFYFSMVRPVVERRRLYLYAFYSFIGLSTLAKGLLGFLLPGAVLFLYILFTRRWRMLKHVELPLGTLIFVSVTVPWYAGMLIRHPDGFWDRFFVHDHFKRLASGVHQIDTGSLEHFMRWLGYGLFPWSALIPAALAVFLSGNYLRKNSRRAHAVLLTLFWGVVAFTLFTLSSTKFHHYIFPAVPPLALLVAVAVDEQFERDEQLAWPLYVVATGLVALFAIEFIQDPPLLKDLFTYKYERDWDASSWNSGFQWAIFLITIPGFVGTILYWWRDRVVQRWGLAGLFTTAVGFALFGLHVYMPQISSTWSQKGLWSAYYEDCTRVQGPPGAHPMKRFCKEPAISYKLIWRGETFYTQNQVIPVQNDDDFDHFLEQNKGDTFYALLQPGTYRGQFKRQLPDRYDGKSCIIHDENIKFILVKVPCQQHKNGSSDEDKQ